MNHRVPGIERAYNIHDYFDERKEALEKVNSRITTLVCTSKA
jgi:hypothetical protein